MSEQFQELKPICVAVSKYAFLPQDAFDGESKELLKHMRELNSTLENIDAQGSDNGKLVEYVFIPISHILNQSQLGRPQTKEVLRTLTQLFRIYWQHEALFSDKLATQLFPILNYLIKNLDQPPNSQSKIVTIDALSIFFTALGNQSYATTFFTDNDFRLLSHLTDVIQFILTILLETPEDHSLQLKICGILSELYRRLLSHEVLSYVLPGNISVLTKVLCIPGVNVNYRVICKVIQLYGYLLMNVYDDLELQTTVPGLEDVAELGKQEITVRKPFRHRDSKWLKATRGQILLALQNCIPVLIKRNNSKINETLVRMISQTLSSCAKSLNNCIPLLIETLLNLGESPSVELYTYSDTVYDIARNKLVMQIPHSLQFHVEQTFNSLQYAIKTGLSNHPNNNVLVKEALEAVVNGLDSLFCSRIKKPNEKILVQSSKVILHGLILEPSEMQLLPSNVIDKKLEYILVQFISEIGQTFQSDSELAETIDYLLNHEGNDNNRIRQSISLFVSATLLHKTTVTDDTSPIDEILVTDTSVITKEEASYTILEYISGLSTLENELTDFSRCCILYSLNIMAQNLQAEFQTELIDFLYPIVEDIISSSPAVRQFATNCVVTLSNVLYQGSIKELILQNVDYMIESISQRLNLGMTGQVTTVLMLVCQMAGYETVLSFKDVLETIFKLLDYYHGYDDLCQQIFQFFEVVTVEMKRLYLPNTDAVYRLGDPHSNHSTFKPWGLTTEDQMERLINSVKTPPTVIDEDLPLGENEPANFQEYFDAKLKIKQEDKDSDDEADDEEEQLKNGPPKVEWISPIPRESYRTLIQFNQYGERLLTHPSKPLKIQILKVMKMVTSMLSTQYDLLLPQVAQVWDSVVRCTSDTDHSIVNAACETLKEIIDYSGDFIAKRFLDLWPYLKKNCALLRETRYKGSFSVSNAVIPKRNFPPVTQNALISMSNMLLSGLQKTEVQWDETDVLDVIQCCLLVVPLRRIAEQSLFLSDICWCLSHDT
ncbi:Tti1p KNAG_0M01090 [Huiozyma naganishii CBS 8797]|uniref:TEL2-interacting protein 1 n=1 Tax=Huiozyma naganishii (strain ATCC MYA-139 / BCRC 22969 / CBS 8797 / KCTC 17520 / NBRC 10181 / NCYC 3082 / Yp74L-3) TaxID=1071383 RepID=J7S435_HUIN7|nr:hypothetical protein KNAG_0M01090 [Kazachstania naganishii CBS 8797]CCK72962.1 hypothetical protein KNAG_0M01090 [Kazachstania naganishii CBS 8797]